MKKTSLKVKIERPISEVFAFAINPNNTPKWIDGIATEETDGWPVGVGSLYRNKSKQTGKWTEFTVTDFDENKLFLLTNNNNNYHVKYSFTSLTPNLTELEYEWADNGELEASYIQGLLDNLKRVVESD